MWQGILGHDDVVERFRQSLAAGRLASSYLLLGPAGVGKRSLALKLAQALLCQNCEPEQFEPCGQCESCRQAVQGSHPDINVVELPEGKRLMPVELFLGDRQHRNQEGLCHDIALRPLLGRRRVAIVDDADQLTVESSNCLLKTLEEPPPGAVLMLLATSRSRLLPTILSRTQVVRCAELATEDLVALLIGKGFTQDETQARELAEMSRGSLQRARMFADPQCREVRDWLLPLLRPSAIETLQITKQLHDFVNSAGKDAQARRERMRLLFLMVSEHFRELLRISCQGAKAASSEIEQSVAELGSAAQQCALSILDRCLAAEEELDRNANQATLLECWVDDLARILAAEQTVLLI